MPSEVTKQDAKMNTDIHIDRRPFQLRVLAVKHSGRFSGSSEVHTESPPKRQTAYRVPNGTIDPDSASRFTFPPETLRTADGTGPEIVSQTLQGRLDYLPQRSRRMVKRLLLATAGHVGAGAISVATLVVTLLSGGYADSWVLESLIGLILIRLIYHLTRGPVPALGRYRIRKRFRWVVSDEIQVSVAFIAACYLMKWPISYTTLGVFVTLNLLLQVSSLYYARMALKAVGKDVYTADDAAFARRAVILGTGKHAQQVADMVLGSPDLDTKLAGFLDYRKTGLWRYRDVPLIGHPDDLEMIVANSQVDAVFVAVDPDDIGNSRGMFDMAERMGVCVFVMPNVYYPTVSKIRPSYVNGMPALVYRSVPENRSAIFLKSLIDKIGAACFLTVASPVMALTAVLVKLESRGPVFFRQVRTGLNGRKFHMYKFRTMCSDAEEKREELTVHNEMTGPVFKIRKDPRITRVGRLLRKFSIDELPQFFNVLKGDMSLVGPRPPLPSEVVNYEPWQHRKLSVKPGVTCLWQINGRNRVTFEEWMRMDLEYIDRWSLWLDAKILVKTVPAVLKGTGV
jgi:exopolysaccharide biosynthesis polyprenyl glycosylphosphotransferase